MKKFFQNTLLIICTFLVFPVLGQTGGHYDLTWSTIDSGGGTSNGGTYTVRGTIGQHDAAYSAGGDYELLGGFWIGSVPPGCFPASHPDYDEWVDVCQPSCWCFPRQCHGDADYASSGKKNWWVSTSDLTILKAAWQIPNGPVTEPNICADFDHKASGKKNWRVSASDLTILKKNWQIDNKPDPNCF